MGAFPLSYCPHDADELLDWTDSDPVDERDDQATFEHSLIDTLVNTEVLLPQGEELWRAKVKKWHTNSDGAVVGTYNDNPLLNSIVYNVEFLDGTVKEYAANTIAQNMYMTLDSQRREQYTLDAIAMQRFLFYM